MEEQAHITGDVVDSRFSDPDGDFLFLMEDSTHRFTISLKEIGECLKYAEEQNEIPPLPEGFWFALYNRYPDMYKGQEHIEFMESIKNLGDG